MFDYHGQPRNRFPCINVRNPRAFHGYQYMGGGLGTGTFKHTEESESGIAPGYVNVKNASQPNGLENFNTYNNQISFMETESHCYLIKLQHQLLL